MPKTTTLFAIAGGLVALATAGACWLSSTGPVERRPAARGSDAALATYIALTAAASARQDEANPLADYRPGPGGARPLAQMLAARSVPVTVRSVVAARTLLQGSEAGTDERLLLLRILGSLHTPEDSTGYNRQIELDLRMLAADGVPALARAAAVELMRIAARAPEDLRRAMLDGIASPVLAAPGKPCLKSGQSSEEQPDDLFSIQALAPALPANCL